MELQTISHASYLFKAERTTVLVDPWWKGRAYFASWALAPGPLPEVLSSLPSADYIYITHEHPDHLDIDTLNDLLPKGTKTTLLIPRFMRDRLYRMLKEIYPYVDIIELTHAVRYQFGDLSLRSYQYRNDDSVLVCQTEEGFTVVNSNDSFVKGKTLEKIIKDYPQVDVLLNQFTASNAYPYAYADFEKEKENLPWQKQDLNNYCINLLNAVRPKFWIPYHSFVKFCRPENDWLNRHSTSLDEIVDFCTGKTNVTEILKLYPGDCLKGERIWRHPKSEHHFRNDLPEIQRPKDEHYNSAELQASMNHFETSFKKDVSFLFRRLLDPTGFEIVEDGFCMIFHPKTSKFEWGDSNLKSNHPMIAWTAVSGSMLTDALQSPWGLGNLLISGCIKTTVSAENRGRDFRFWAVNLIRHTGYFNLASLWFLRPRAIITALRRGAELCDIVLNTLRTGSLMTGNIEPSSVSKV